MLRHAVCLISIVVAALGPNVSTTAFAQARTGGAPAVKVCSLLSRDLVMKVSTAAAQKEFDYAKPVENYLGQELGGAGRPASCSYGPIVLVLNPLGQPDHIRNLLRTRTKPYEKFEPVAGVGDAAFFEGNRNFANLYVWTGSRHFHVEMMAAASEHGKDLKPNTITLANAVLPQLR